ncbi:MAG: FAD-dependent oxidoreductase, partial [Archaeoglobaceae archaeon]
AVDVLMGKVEVGRRVVIIGGGRIGCETALYLAEKGKDVTILEILPTIASDVERNYGFALMRELKNKNVKWICNFRTERIEDGKVVGFSDGKMEIECDSVVIATGMRSRKIELKLKVPCYYIGDCVKPRKIRDAVYEAVYLASKI